MANTKPDAAQITYQAAGTGSQVRTVDSKLGDSVSVFDFMTSAQITAVKTNTWTTEVPDVTAAWSLEMDDKWQGKLFRPIIDFLFSLLQKDHCRKCWLEEQRWMS